MDDTKQDHQRDSKERQPLTETGEASDAMTEDLLRLALEVPTLDPDRSSRIRQAFDQSLATQIQRRRLRTRLQVGAALAAGILLIIGGDLLPVGRWLVGGGHDSGWDAARVEVVKGEAFLTAAAGEPGVGETELRFGDSVAVGTEVRTGPDGRAALSFDAGSVRLDTGSRMTLISRTVIRLEEGAVYYDSGGMGGDPEVELLTPYGTLRCLGTQFEARLGKESLRVRVREGLVAVAEGQVEELHVSAGRGVEISSLGAVDWSENSRFDSSWNWAIEAAPGLMVSGMRLGEVMDWAGREVGWQARFANEELARSVPSIVVHDGAETLYPLEILTVLLPTAGLTHRIEGDTLMIRSSSADQGAASKRSLEELPAREGRGEHDDEI